MDDLSRAGPAVKDIAGTAGRFGRGDLGTALLLALLAFLVYNANLRLIATGDSLPARFLPFAVWTEGSLYLDPVLKVTVRDHPAPYWILRTRDGHIGSMYPVVAPLLVTPLYAPAVLYLDAKGWNDERLARIGKIMEKVSASVVASVCVALMYLALRRRAGRPMALLLTLAFALGTNTWMTSSQALWQHGVTELLLLAALLCFTGRPSWAVLVTAGAACGLLIANRLADAPLAAALAAFSPFWARRRWPVFAAAAAVPLALLVTYNLSTFGLLGGGYAVVLREKGGGFFSFPILPGLAGLLMSPGKGLFVFSPFLAALPVFWRRTVADERYRLLTLCLAGGVLLELLAYSRIDWRGGSSYGPRYLSSMLPVVVWMLPPVVAALGRMGRAVFLVLVLFSAGVQAIGAFCYRGHSDGLFNQAPQTDLFGVTWRLGNVPFVLDPQYSGCAPGDLLELVQEEARSGGRSAPYS
ncbi:MAG TPA: hypothetical protein VEL74_13415 [Thermoanaerobaculia bacterium]|nr:hypothetical protein [Thermoanaerobaculia bacterium]